MVEPVGYGTNHSMTLILLNIPLFHQSESCKNSQLCPHDELSTNRLPTKRGFPKRPYWRVLTPLILEKIRKLNPHRPKELQNPRGALRIPEGRWPTYLPGKGDQNMIA